MGKKCLFLLLLIFFCPGFSRGEPVTDKSIDVHYYSLKLLITPQYDSIRGLIEVKADVRGPEFFLNIGSNLSVLSVCDKNGAPLYFKKDDFLHIKLNDSTSQRADVLIRYSGRPTESYYIQRVNGKPLIWTSSEPYGSSQWWPCKDSPEDKADSSEMEISCPGNLNAVSNGKLIKVTENKDGSKTFLWKNSYPIATYLIAMAAFDYIHYTEYYKYSPMDSLPVENYLFPENLEYKKQILHSAINGLEFFSKILGPYPFLTEKYGHAETRLSGGMENQTITGLGYFSEPVVIHELAHQWFGDKITCKSWGDVWLNEGFATYMEILYEEHFYGKDRMDDLINGIFSDARTAPGSLYLSDTQNEGNIFLYSRAYAKGASVLHMLRGILGEDLFFNLLKAYTQNPALSYGGASTTDLEQTAEKLSGLNLEYFFNQWVYGEGCPKIDISWKTHYASGFWQTNLHIFQEDRENPCFFRLPADLSISFLKADSIIRINISQKEQDFYFRFKNKPLGLKFDPKNFILKQFFDFSDSSEFRGLGKDMILYQNYPNPFGEETRIKYSIPNGTYLELGLYDMLGRRVQRIFQGFRNPGTYLINLKAAELPSGCYILRLQAGGITETKKLLHLK